VTIGEFAMPRPFPVSCDNSRVGRRWAVTPRQVTPGTGDVFLW